MWFGRTLIRQDWVVGRPRCLQPGRPRPAPPRAAPSAWPLVSCPAPPSLWARRGVLLVPASLRHLHTSPPHHTPHRTHTAQPSVSCWRRSRYQLEYSQAQAIMEGRPQPLQPASQHGGGGTGEQAVPAADLPPLQRNLRLLAALAEHRRQMRLQVRPCGGPVKCSGHHRRCAGLRSANVAAPSMLPAACPVHPLSTAVHRAARMCCRTAQWSWKVRSCASRPTLPASLRA